MQKIQFCKMTQKQEKAYFPSDDDIFSVVGYVYITFTILKSYIGFFGSKITIFKVPEVSIRKKTGFSFCLNEVSTIGNQGRIMRRGPIMRCFGLSCFRPVYFLRKSTEFHDMRTECQRILPTAYALFHILSPIFALRSLPDHSPIAPRSNPASVFPPIFDTLDWMEMQTSLPFSGLLKLCYRTYSLPQRL